MIDLAIYMQNGTVFNLINVKIQTNYGFGAIFVVLQLTTIWFQKNKAKWTHLASK